MEVVKRSLEVGGKTIDFETGKLAKQASGAVQFTSGDCSVLVTVTTSEEAKNLGYFPLTVQFEERMYAAGKIPGGFIKREGRPSEASILTCRLIDRPLRPLFPKGFNNEVQIVALTLASDQQNPLDVYAINAASAALMISKTPFEGPVGAARVGRVDGQFILNPSFEEIENGDLNMVVAGTKNGITMVEAGSNLISEQIVLDALEFGYNAILKMLDMQIELREACGQPKMEFEAPKPTEGLAEEVANLAKAKLEDILSGRQKKVREKELKELKSEILAAMAEKYPEGEKDEEIAEALGALQKATFRGLIKAKNVRPDGRSKTDIRSIWSERNALPRVHGSAIFTRGETQVLSIVTLGSLSEGQRVDGIYDDKDKRYMHMYNFPPFCTGETKPMRGPSRRDIGHGALAERALIPVLPKEEDFPYAIRVMSEVLESNGSSSMASVCGSSMSLMDAGVPIKEPVAGIAMGLVLDEQGGHHILSDIQGVEDGYGDMDFKVAGSRNGISALQMDIKCHGLTKEVMAEALEQARLGRLHIHDRMAETISVPEPDLKPQVPRVIRFEIDPEKIGNVIGPAGKNIRRIIAETDTKIDIDDNGQVLIYANDREKAENALNQIKAFTEEVEVGKEYLGVVKKITSFGAFVEVLPGTEGLLHISQISKERINRVEDVMNIGDKVKVTVREIDDMDRVNVTMRPKEEWGANDRGGPRREGGSGGGGGRRDFGGRPPRRDGDRPPRRDGGNRPPRRDGQD